MEWEFLAHAVGLSALAVVVVQQILKSKLIPTGFANRYPVPTNIILSVLASIVVLWNQLPAMTRDPLAWAVFVTTVAVVAAITYNNLLRPWTQLRETEGN